MRRVTARMSVIAMFAVASVSTSGVLVRTIPFDRAYGTSRLLYPTATLEMIFKLASRVDDVFVDLVERGDDERLFALDAADELVFGEHAVSKDFDVADGVSGSMAEEGSL